MLFKGGASIVRHPNNARLRISTLVLFAAVVLLPLDAALADSGAGSLIDGAKPLADIRLRYESVNDKTKALHGDAVTLRARLGVQTGSWSGFSLLAEMDGVIDLTTDFNNTRNGKTSYPIIADPEMAALNRLQLTYASDFDTTLIAGRQRIVFGDQRFVGNAGWRQHEQTFDAVLLSNSSVKGLSLNYAYVDRVNRVYGPGSANPATGPAGAFHCDCHLFDAVYSGVPRLKVEATGLLVDVSQRVGVSSAKLATAKLSTVTLGVQGSYQVSLLDSWTAQLLAAYAHQSNYRNNPVSFSLDYWRGEGSLSYGGASAVIGYEAMQGNGVVGFSTPLATIHGFDGWADMFLTTPSNGLDNLYLKASYKSPDVAELLHIDSATGTIVHRDFAAERIGAGIGSEWDGALEIAYSKFSLLLQYSDYQGSGIGLGGFADKSIGWMQLSYKY